MANTTQSSILPLGNLSMSREVQALLAKGTFDPYDYLRRHATGDWGDISEDGRQANDAALRNNGPVHSVYQIAPDLRLSIITEGDRRTTLMSIAQVDPSLIC